MLCPGVWGLSHGPETLHAWDPREPPSTSNQECLGTRGKPSNPASPPAPGNTEGHRGNCLWHLGPHSS